MTTALTLHAVGLASGLARTAGASCAVMRLGYDCFQETPFQVANHHLKGARIDYLSMRGLKRLVEVLNIAIDDALQNASLNQLGTIRLILCLPDGSKPYNPSDIVERFHKLISPQLDDRFDHRIHYEASGALGVVNALLHARHLLMEDNTVQSVLIAGVDNFLNVNSIGHHAGDLYGDGCRLLTEDNADGFIPGEAAGAVLLTRAAAGATGLLCKGIGTGAEPAPCGSGEVTRATGLVDAINMAVGEAGCTVYDTDYRISNLNGERYFFEEDSLALYRTLRPPKAEHPLWHPADSIGHVGAASGLAMLANVFWASHKGYAPGARCLALLSGEDAPRGALVLEFVDAG